MQKLEHPTWPSVNGLTQPLVEELKNQADALRLRIETLSNGTTLIDAGIHAIGGLEAGRRIAEICMGGLGFVSLQTGTGRWPISLSVDATNPVLACLGSQYAGWSLSHGEGKGAFRALASGPGRALALKEELFSELGYRDAATSTCFVLEVDSHPPLEIIAKVARDCGVAPERLTFILTPTRSLAGVVQIVARVLEVALHKVHALGFPLGQIIDGAGTAPLPPPAKDFIISMGRTNDAILFGGRVQLYVDCSDADARDLAEKLPASASRDYGESFAQIFKAVEYDFYKIDPMLFAPAEVIVSTLKGGKTFRAGKINETLLESSFS
ncbi:MAG: methenyltetrahydromethanopterin cyclohydrolase [Burkholderiales bacterium]